MGSKIQKVFSMKGGDECERGERSPASGETIQNSGDFFHPSGEKSGKH